MKTLLSYIDTHWGKTQTCASCKSVPAAMCGSCFNYVYCGTSCQRDHWLSIHQYECVNGRTKRGDEEGEEDGSEKKDDNPAAAKKAHVVDDADKEEISIEDLSRDVWQRISHFLEGQDLKNLSLAQRIVQQRLRETYFRRFRFILYERVFEDAHFKEIVTYIQAVLVFSIGDLNKVIKMGAPVYDVRFSEMFDKSVDKLPAQITRLALGFRFNHPVDKLPTQLTHLDLSGLHFNQRIDNLPPTLTHLRLGEGFNQPISRLPANLEHLMLSRWYSISLPLTNATVVRVSWYYSSFHGHRAHWEVDQASSSR